MLLEGNTCENMPKRKVDDITSGTALLPREKGVAPIKSEYLSQVSRPPRKLQNQTQDTSVPRRDHHHPQDRGSKKAKGQNTNRSFGSSRDATQLCTSRSRAAEFDPVECEYGEGCKYEHDIRKYIQHGKGQDLSTLGSKCPVWDECGRCPSGWKCRFATSHSEEKLHNDGRMELVLKEGQNQGHDVDRAASKPAIVTEDFSPGVVNCVTSLTRKKLRKHQIDTPLADKFTTWLTRSGLASEAADETPSSGTPQQHGDRLLGVKESASRYVEPRLFNSEKRSLYYGPETPVLAPLTTQGNLPFRRLCVSLGAQVTWSEMAMSTPLIQGQRSEWALMKAHESELMPPKFEGLGIAPQRYDSSSDLRFGAQIAASKAPVAAKATEVLSTLCPHLRAIDLNCGCPIDLVYRRGAGSALLDNESKLEKIIRGMSAVSGTIPITAKIRMGTRDDKPTADRLIRRLAYGGVGAKEAGLGPSGVAALTLHGRSRQQRYTKKADWGYIGQIASLIKMYNDEVADNTDTIREVDPRSSNSNKDGRIFFVGNGDCYSHEDYFSNISNSKCDTVAVARGKAPVKLGFWNALLIIFQGAVIKPWIFEEIEKQQYLDKSASERLGYIERFVKAGLAHFGCDSIGVDVTRRFLLEWLSFAHRYVPIGLLEHLPPNIQDRPPAFKGRNDMETLMASDSHTDWLALTNMFLGPPGKDFKFQPKHKSNSYDTNPGDFVSEG